MEQSLRVVTRVLLDGVCLVIVVSPIFWLGKYYQPYRRGFFCDDDSIRYPYHGDTVTNDELEYVGTLLPILTILVTEFIRGTENRGEPLALFGVKIPTWVVNVYKCVGIFGFGLASTNFITDVGKLTVGRLRPHFMDVCKPNVDCSDPALAHVYIVKYNCTSGNALSLTDARKSFPSGHSSFSSYTMVFAMLYLQERFTWKGSLLLCRLYQLCCLIMFWFTGLSRISDNKHHPTDVLAGLTLGISMALLTWPFIRRVFRRTKGVHDETTRSQNHHF